MRPRTWFLLSVMLFIAAAFFWQLGEQRNQERRAAEAKVKKSPAPASATNLPHQAPAVSNTLSSPKTNSAATMKSAYPYRLSNTTQGLKELQRNDRAVLLRNALIDTTKPINLAIPEHLRAKKDSQSYIVQSGRALDEAFYAQLRQAGATFVAYIPNNAALVYASADNIKRLQPNGQLRILPYHPYYKLDPKLLPTAIAKKSLPAQTKSVDSANIASLLLDSGNAPSETLLSITAFPNQRDVALRAIASSGGELIGEDRSPFGPQLIIRPKADSLVSLAQSFAIEEIEPFVGRGLLNDLTRARVKVSPNTTIATNWNGLTGANVVVNVDDSGVDASHPDLLGRILGMTNDFEGHGTHVAGIIAGDGSKSATVSKADGSIIPAVTGQFRGKAPGAQLFVQQIDLVTGPLISDSYLQETAAAQTNCLISNDSWEYLGTSGYEMPAASYDAAVRDALPDVPGSQPMLFVFAAGNSGNGDDNGQNAQADTISAPAAAKNVITVGAIENLRNITNNVSIDGVNTNAVWAGMTDSSTEVAFFSSRGNVGIDLEGEFGRFKPDVVAPGVFVISTRATNWNNPTNFNSIIFNRIPDQTISPGQTNVYPITIPANGVQLTIQIVPNALSPNPLPSLPIVADQNTQPTTAQGSGTVTLPVIPGNWYFGITNPSNQPVAYDVQTFITITNAAGDFFTVLQTLNDGLKPFYRYESGTSMAAPAVTGVLALMQEFFATKLSITNPSPALLKAMLINGARSVSSLYDFQVQRTDANDQGWGLVSISNSIPTNLTATTGSLLFFEQSPTNSLATGDSHTRMITTSPAARGYPLRITLVWTDPPGNPAASIKLVNDLDLIVTNLDTQEVFVGNNFSAGNTFSDSDIVEAPSDIVNNVENVYINGNFTPLATNYSVTVRAKRVNVNAVTTNTVGIVQDYALVISSGNPNLPDPVTVIGDQGITSITNALVTVASNGIPLLNQRVGANSPLLDATGNGTMEQWHFFIYTNTPAMTNANFTNVALITFFPPNLSRSRITDADIDLYVATGTNAPNLLNLDPIEIANASKSTNRGGTELVTFTNSTPGQVYYCGVKSEDQQAAEFGFFGIASDKPFDSQNADGSFSPLFVPLPGVIPDGTPSSPQAVTILGISTMTQPIRRVAITNLTITHQLMGDLFGQLTHNGRVPSVVLNNHSSHGTNLTQTVAYDDSNEGDIFDPNGNAAIHTDGPGSLRDFVSLPGTGVWLLTMVDNALNHTGQVDSIGMKLDPKLPTNSIVRTIGANGWFYDYVDVPNDATNLQIVVSYQSGTGPVDIFVRKGVFPVGAAPPDDKSDLGIGAPGGALNLGTNDVPPLSGGRYFYGIHNTSGSSVTIQITIIIQRSLTPDLTGTFFSTGSTNLLDDAISRSQILITNNQAVVSVQVGVLIDHPRASDLVLHLISPQGTRILLSENRGRTSTNGYGASIVTTNVLPRRSSGGPQEDRNVIDTGLTSGTVVISYDFFTVPDTLHVYYGGVRIFDSGPVSFSGTFNVNYGPGTSTQVTIVVNEGGSADSVTKWTYTASVVTEQIFYTVFTENTNLASQLIKFAPPPFASVSGTTTNIILFTDDFETVPAGTYTNGQTVEDWTVLTNYANITNLTNQIGIITDTNLAYSGNNLLALANGHIAQLLPTQTGKPYRLTYSFRGPGITDWWPADGKANDLIGTNNGTTSSNLTYLVGEAGKAFSFDGTTNSSVTFGTNTGNFGTNDFTIDFWIKTTDTNQQAVLCKRSACGANSMFDIRIGGGNGVGRIGAEVCQDASGSNYNGLHLETPINDGVFHHFAFMRHLTNLSLYLDGVLGTNITTTDIADINNTTDLVAGTSPCVSGPGFSDGTFNFTGQLDELDLFNRALSPAEINAIYLAASAGKYDASSVLPSVQILVDGVTTNKLVDNSYTWQTDSIGFVAQTNGTLLELDGNPLGMLFDTFVFEELPNSHNDNYFFPEESLQTLAGENALGYWTLEVWDDRAGAAVSAQLVSWKLDLTFSSTNVNLTVLTNQMPSTNTVAANSIEYFAVDVPANATFATNILTSISGGPLDLLFNQTGLPTGNLPGDVTLLQVTTNGGSYLLSKNGTPPFLLPGQRYFLGVKNSNPAPQTFTLEVDFDTSTNFNVTPLTNAIALSTNILATNTLQYFYFDVSTNATLVSFEILGPTNDVDLVVRHTLPLPDRLNFDYISSNPGTNNEAIVVTTNSLPAPLTSGRWYLAVYSFTGTNAADYSIRATEITNGPTVITLTNGVAYPDVAQPGPAFSTFYQFTITNNDAAVQFTVDTMSDDVDLIVREGSFPTPQQSDRGSFNTNTISELIVIATNAALPSLNGTWYLGVPNNTATTNTFNITATLLTSGTNFPAAFKFTGANFSANGDNGLTFSWNAVAGKKYEIDLSTNLPVWQLLTNVTATSSSASFTDPTPMQSAPLRFYRLLQVP